MNRLELAQLTSGVGALALGVVVILQLWPLTATMNAWPGGDDSVVWPAAAVRAGRLGPNAGLPIYLRRIERTRKAGA